MTTFLPRPTSSRGKRRRGSVLIVVLWVSLGLVAITIAFGSSMLMAFRGADNDFAGRQADQAIEGAVRYVETVLINTGTPGEFPDVTTYQSQAVPVGDANFWLIGRDNDVPPTTSAVFSLVDEASKLNINTATQDMLAALPGMTDDLAAGIVDWRDANDSAAGGADSSTYMAMQPAYIDKQAPFESVQELALIYGLDSIILFGEDANLNGTLDPNEDDGDKSDPPDNADGQLDPGIFEYLTCFTQEPNTQSDGTAKISVASLGSGSNAALTALAAINSNVSTQLSSRLPKTAKKFTSVLQFYNYCSSIGISDDDFNTIGGAITTATGTSQTGLINVHTASETVLEAVLGGDDTAAQGIISARQSLPIGDTTLIWVAKYLSTAEVTSYGQYLTGMSYQVTADVAAVGRNGRGFRRTSFVIDTSGLSTASSTSTTGSTGSTGTTGTASSSSTTSGSSSASGSSGAAATITPVIVYRRNLSPLGWALGVNGRQTLNTLTTTGS